MLSQSSRCGALKCRVGLVENCPSKWQQVAFIFHPNLKREDHKRGHDFPVKVMMDDQAGGENRMFQVKTFERLKKMILHDTQRFSILLQEECTSTHGAISTMIPPFKSKTGCCRQESTCVTWAKKMEMVENEWQRNAQVANTAHVFCTVQSNSLRKVEFLHVLTDSQVTSSLEKMKVCLQHGAPCDAKVTRFCAQATALQLFIDCVFNCSTIQLHANNCLSTWHDEVMSSVTKIKNFKMEKLYRGSNPSSGALLGRDFLVLRLVSWL